MGTISNKTIEKTDDKYADKAEVEVIGGKIEALEGKVETLEIKEK